MPERTITSQLVRHALSIVLEEDSDPFSEYVKQIEGMIQEVDEHLRRTQGSMATERMPDEPAGFDAVLIRNAELEASLDRTLMELQSCREELEHETQHRKELDERLKELEVKLLKAMGMR